MLHNKSMELAYVLFSYWETVGNEKIIIIIKNLKRKKKKEKKNFESEIFISSSLYYSSSSLNSFTYSGFIYLFIFTIGIRKF